MNIQFVTYVHIAWMFNKLLLNNVIAVSEIQNQRRRLKSKESIMEKSDEKTLYISMKGIRKSW